MRVAGRCGESSQLGMEVQMEMPVAVAVTWPWPWPWHCPLATTLPPESCSPEDLALATIRSFNGPLKMSRIQQHLTTHHGV